MPHISQIAIVEQHGLVRRGLESLLTGCPLLSLVAVVAEPAQLDPASLSVDVIVFGPSRRAEQPLNEAVAELAALGRVLVIADLDDRQLVTAVLRAGAYGCVTRQADDDELLCAVGTVMRGGVHIAPGLAARLHAELQQPSVTPPPTLARREIETLRWLAAGLTHGQIARRMSLTEATVSTYVKRIRNKLNVGNKADLTRKAIELGLLHEGHEGVDAEAAADNVIQDSRVPRMPPAA
jgi:DNA-binding NarL/FixJ family response regulator